MQKIPLYPIALAGRIIFILLSQNETELKIDETIIRSAEWIQSPCPRCGAEWAVVEPRGKRPGATRRRTLRRAAARIMRPRAAAGGKAAGITPSGIRSLRKKLGISQKELAVLAGVSPGSVVSWENGKFKPKGNKMARLVGLLTKEKEEIGKLLSGNMPMQENKAGQARAGKPKGRGRARQKVGPPAKK